MKVESSPFKFLHNNQSSWAITSHARLNCETDNKKLNNIPENSIKKPVTYKQSIGLAVSNNTEPKRDSIN